jgi:hypothetical protein
MVNFAGESIVCLVMTIFPRIRKAFFCCALVGWLLPVGHVFAQNHSMNCHDTLSPIHAELTNEDQNSANHLEVNRRLRPEVAIVLDICDADVTIKGSNTHEPKQDLLPESDIDFFSTSADDVYTFETDAKGHVSGMTLHTDGKDIPIKRVD